MVEWGRDLQEQQGVGVGMNTSIDKEKEEENDFLPIHTDPLIPNGKSVRMTTSSRARRYQCRSFL